MDREAMKHSTENPGKFASLILNGIVGVCDSATRNYSGPVSRDGRLSQRTLSIDQRAAQRGVSAVRSRFATSQARGTARLGAGGGIAKPVGRVGDFRGG